MPKLSRDQKWRVVSLGSAVLAGLAVRAGIQAVWRVAGDDRPPMNPLEEDSTWMDAVLFAVATGATVGLARVGARAVAASLWDEDGSLHLSTPWK